MKKTGTALILTILSMLIFITACGGDKDGTAGYSYVYVSDVLKSLEKNVDSITGIEKGTEARHKYLQTFTGVFAQFSEVHGVWVIRLSNNFSASQQTELAKIIKTVITDLN